MADRKKATVLNPRVDTSKFPKEWIRNQQPPKPEQLEMHIPMGEKLPRIKVTLHSGKDLKKDCFISIKIGNTPPCFGSAATKPKLHAWNEEFIVRLEPGNSPFLATIECYKSGPLGKGKQYLGGVSVDLFSDFGMRFNGEQRRWNYQFPDIKGEVAITFEALTDLTIPQMRMSNIDGKLDTTSLPVKRPPEIQLTIYQAIRINGDKPLVCQIEVYHRTYDLITNMRLEACLLRTKQFRGYSPYWDEKVIVPLNTKNDSIFIIMKFLLGKEEKGVGTVVELFVDEIGKISTATESRRWYAFTDFFLGGCLGVGVLALSNMSVLNSLPILNIPKVADQSRKIPPPVNPSTQLKNSNENVVIPQKALTVEELRAMARQSVIVPNAPKGPEKREVIHTIPIQQAQVQIQEAKQQAQLQLERKNQKLTEMYKDNIELLCSSSLENRMEDVVNILAHPNIDEFINLKSERGVTALFCAAKQGHVNVLLKLLLVGSIDVDGTVEPHGGTALHAASFRGFFDCVSLLLAAGANSSKVNRAGLSARQEAKGKAMDVYQIFETDGIYGLKRQSAITNTYLMSRKVPDRTPLRPTNTPSSVPQRRLAEEKPKQSHFNSNDHRPPNSGMNSNEPIQRASQRGIPGKPGADPSNRPAFGVARPTSLALRDSQRLSSQLNSPVHNNTHIPNNNNNNNNSRDISNNSNNSSVEGEEILLKRKSRNSMGKYVKPITSNAGRPGIGASNSIYSPNDKKEEYTPQRPSIQQSIDKSREEYVPQRPNTAAPISALNSNQRKDLSRQDSSVVHAPTDESVMTRQKRTGQDAVPIPKKLKLKNAYDSLMEQENFETQTSGGGQSFQEEEIPNTTHVLALITLLDSIRIPFQINEVNKGNWRNTLKVQAYDNLGGAEILLGKQLQRLEEMTDIQSTIDLDKKDDDQDLYELELEMGKISEEFKTDMEKYAAELIIEPSFDIDASLMDDTNKDDDDFFGSDFANLDDLLEASIRPKPSLKKVMTMDFNVHDNVNFDEDDNLDDNFLSSIGIDARIANQSIMICALCDCELTIQKVKIKKKNFCPSCSDRMIKASKDKGLIVQIQFM